LNEVREEGAVDQIPLTVIVITYNHESYVRQALDSVLAQETSFPFEIIISEDRSTDSTRDILQEYQALRPDRIRLLLSEVNLHDNEVVSRAIRAARGKYIAFLDGDDYWVSTDKLQKQHDYMEAHPETAITYHPVERINEEGALFLIHTGAVPGKGNRIDIDDLIHDNVMAACSVVHRRAALGDPPEWVRDLPHGDWPMAIIAAQKGFVDRIDDIVARYRWNRHGVWSGLTQTEQWTTVLTVLDAVERHLETDHREAFARSRAVAIAELRKAVKAETPKALVEMGLKVTDKERQAIEATRMLDQERKRLRLRANRILAGAAAAAVAALAAGWTLGRWL
jgi:glycosyltransferase involved in cell wall biosynthesis